MMRSLLTELFTEYSEVQQLFDEALVLARLFGPPGEVIRIGDKFGELGTVKSQREYLTNVINQYGTQGQNGPSAPKRGA